MGLRAMHLFKLQEIFAMCDVWISKINSRNFQVRKLSITFVCRHRKVLEKYEN